MLDCCLRELGMPRPHMSVQECAYDKLCSAAKSRASALLDAISVKAKEASDPVCSVETIDALLELVQSPDADFVPELIEFSNQYPGSRPVAVAHSTSRTGRPRSREIPDDPKYPLEIALAELHEFVMGHLANEGLASQTVAEHVGVGFYECTKKKQEMDGKLIEKRREFQKLYGQYQLLVEGLNQKSALYRLNWEHLEAMQTEVADKVRPMSERLKAQNGFIHPLPDLLTPIKGTEVLGTESYCLPIQNEFSGVSTRLNLGSAENYLSVANASILDALGKCEQQLGVVLSKPWGEYQRTIRSNKNRLYRDFLLKLLDSPKQLGESAVILKVILQAVGCADPFAQKVRRHEASIIREIKSFLQQYLDEYYSKEHLIDRSFDFLKPYDMLLQKVAEIVSETERLTKLDDVAEVDLQQRLDSLVELYNAGVEKHNALRGEVVANNEVIEARNKIYQEFKSLENFNTRMIESLKTHSGCLLTDAVGQSLAMNKPYCCAEKLAACSERHRAAYDQAYKDRKKQLEILAKLAEKISRHDVVANIYAAFNSVLPGMKQVIESLRSPDTLDSEKFLACIEEAEQLMLRADSFKDEKLPSIDNMSLWKEVDDGVLEVLENRRTMKAHYNTWVRCYCDTHLTPYLKQITDNLQLQIALIEEIGVTEEFYKDTRVDDILKDSLPECREILANYKALENLKTDSFTQISGFHEELKACHTKYNAFVDKLGGKIERGLHRGWGRKAYELVREVFVFLFYVLPACSKDQQDEVRKQFLPRDEKLKNTFTELNASKSTLFQTCRSQQRQEDAAQETCALNKAC